jgi:hypothetical protein
VNTDATTRQPGPSAPWTAARIFKMAMAVTLGVIVATLVAFAVLALLFA